MNTNQLLIDAGYKSHPDFPEIAKRAAELAKEGRYEAELLYLIELQYTIPEDDRITMRDEPIPFEVLGKDIIESGAYDQMNKVMSLPISSQGALMPDAHQGYGMPIGGVAILDNAISPNFVGYDIACRMKLSIINISPEDFMANREVFYDTLKDITRFGVGAKFEKEKIKRHKVMEDDRWELIPIDYMTAKKQLGTSGGGNHFADILVGTWLNRPQAQFVALMTHSGSRGAGHKTATKYNKLAIEYTERVAKDIPKGYAWLSLDEPNGQEYWEAMSLMGEYAQANHDLIHEELQTALGEEYNEQYDNHHNFAWREENRVIHRKGATPADNQMHGIIPGSSGTNSYLTVGLGHERFLNSSSHGAGRLFSRTEAKKQYNDAEFRKSIKDDDIMIQSVAADETKWAYKDIETVIKLQEDAGILTPLARMEPKIVIMGGGRGKR